MVQARNKGGGGSGGGGSSELPFSRTPLQKFNLLKNRKHIIAGESSEYRCHGLRVYPVCVCNTVRLGQDTT